MLIIKLLVLCPLLGLFLAVPILLAKRNARWFKCAWHGSEYWYSNLGHRQTFQPWHIEDKDVSHGCCPTCRMVMQKQLLEP